MNERPDDRRVRELLELVGDDRAAAPPFQKLWSRAESAARPRRALPRALPAMAAVAAALALVVLLPRWQGSGAPEPDPMELARSLSSWEAPLDFLLEVPGSELYADPLGRDLAFELPALDLYDPASPALPSGSSKRTDFNG